MAVKKISRLPRARTVNGATLFEIEDDNQSFSATMAQIRAAVGDIQITPFQIEEADDVDAEAPQEGDILVFFDGAWVKVSPGQAGYVLTSNGPGQLPTYQEPQGTVTPTPTTGIRITSSSARITSSAVRITSG